VIGFTDHLQIVTTSNYFAVTNSHTPQFTRARNMYPQFVFTGRFLVTGPNNVFCLRPYLLANITQLTKFKVKVKVKVTLRRAVYRQSVCLGVKPLDTHDQRLQNKLSLSFMLRPAVSRPVCLGIKHPSGAYDQIFITVTQLRVC
jgi:hypothetical protein